jgi:hypothetical protein
MINGRSQRDAPDSEAQNMNNGNTLTRSQSVMAQPLVGFEPVKIITQSFVLRAWF